MRGYLYPNDKGGVDSRPDMRGSIEIDGHTYLLSAWRGSSRRSGIPYLSLVASDTPTSGPSPERATVLGLKADEFLDAVAAAAVLVTEDESA